MNNPQNLAEAMTILVEKFMLSVAKNKHEREQCLRALNELMTAYYRYALPGLGWKRKSYTAKLTAREKRLADEFAATLPVKSLLKFSEAMEQGFALAQATQASQATYGARLQSMLAFVASELWYPGNAVLNRRLPNECRPLMRHGRGDWKALALMEAKGRQLKYLLQLARAGATLKQQLDALKPFMSDPDHLDRCFEALQESTADGYSRGVLLWLGWLLDYDNVALIAEDPILVKPLPESTQEAFEGLSEDDKVARIAGRLTLEHLIPKITQDELEGLSAKERKSTWSKAQRTLEARIKRYFDFLRTKQKADSPRTRVLKLATLLIVAKFVYASEVEHKAEYKTIPVLRTILDLIEKEQKAVEVWEKDRLYVADQSRKWPEPPEGLTVLEYVQQAFIECLRLECRPRQSTGDFCKGSIIAKSHQVFLIGVDLGLLPAGRQQEPRSYRLVLSCPLERPDTVPLDGVYWPQPPDWSRERRRDGSLADNYLYKVYHHDGQFYERGVWVRDRCKYKTHKYHGKRVSVIDNFEFDDGHCLYDYIEGYFCGQWYVGAFRDGHRYDWWDEALQGRYGKWLSQGRAALCAADTPVFTRVGKAEVWVSSYAFLNPQSGQPFTDLQMSDLFARNSYRLLGKRITPHTFRYMWATWAFQMELSDPELESLAHEMGLTVKTLRRMYERCSATEKHRPIDKAMRKLFAWQVQRGPARQGDRLTELKASIAKLNPQELEELRQLLGLDPAA